MTSYASTIGRLQSELAKLQHDDALLASKEAALFTKSNRAREAAGRTKNVSSVTARLKEMERAAHDLADIGKKRSSLSSKIASKSKDLAGYITRQATEDERSRKKVAAEQQRLIREHDQHTKRVRLDLRQVASAPPIEVEQTFDFFISHASEDKASFVAALATELHALGARVFYDDATLKVGDSLRRKIDAGLRNSRFGIVVLSADFFRKEWPARELDGLTALEADGRSRILPIWHKVTKDEVMNYSPVLADKIALNTSMKTVKEIAADLYDLL